MFNEMGDLVFIVVAIIGVLFVVGKILFDAFYKKRADNAADTGTEPRPSTNTKHNLPARNPHFSGREAELGTLKIAFNKTPKTGIASGYSGMGKSSIALEFGYRQLDHYPGGVFWLNADNPTDIAAQIAALSTTLTLDTQPLSEPERHANVHKILCKPPLSLLILDNINHTDWQPLANQLPSGEHCHWLITTRAETLTGVTLQPLNTLSKKETRQLLTSYRTDATEHSRATAKTFRWCGGFALGISTAGIYLKEKSHIHWPDYANDLHHLGSKDHTKNNRHYEKRAQKRTQDTFQYLLEVLPATEQTMLEYAALLPANNIVSDWLRDLFTADPSSPTITAEHSLQNLLTRGLLQKISTRIVRLHPLLAQHLQNQLDEHTTQQRWQQITQHTQQWGKNSHQALTAPDLQQDLTPLSHLCGLLTNASHLEQAAQLANILHAPLMHLARSQASQQNLAPFLNNNAISPQRQADTYSNMALVLQSQGDLPRACDYLEQAIALDTAHLGEDHPTLAIRYSNLAVLLRHQGNLTPAREYMERAIALDIQHRGKDHPTLATSYSNLALILQNQNDLPRARDYMEHAIALDTQHLGDNHLTLTTRYANLALILKDQGDLTRARDYLEQAIALNIQHLGENHSTLATHYANLALILQGQNDLIHARDYIAQAIALNIQHFGENHPTLAISYTNLATIDYAEGHKARACENMQRAYAIQSQHFDNNHPNSQSILQSMALACALDALSAKEKTAIATLKT